MKLNKEKTKLMIFNQTVKYQFSTRIFIEDTLLEIIEETKLLGILITSDLSWNKNTSMLTKKAYARMEILRKLYCFNVPILDLITIYIIYIRCYLEQSCVLWHSSLTQEDSNKLERVQKVALRIILKDKYIGYQHALEQTEMETLEKRRETLCRNFALSCLKHPMTASMFPLNNVDYHEDTCRNREKYFVQKAKTERLMKSAIPYMQRLLNDHSK